MIFCVLSRKIINLIFGFDKVEWRGGGGGGGWTESRSRLLGYDFVLLI